MPFPDPYVDQAGERGRSRLCWPPRAGPQARTPVLIRPRVHQDQRGSFVKTWHPDLLAAHGVAMSFAEEFYSVSRRGVVRGMHFQAPPQALDKLVYCVTGQILDVVLDLRVDQPTYGCSWSWELSEENACLLFIPAGFAHGFLALGERNAVIYKTSAVHSPRHDLGVRWDSFGFAWPETAPVISERDRRLPALDDFNSPFLMP